MEHTHSEILHLYLVDRKTLEQIGEICGVTRERIRQILSKYPEYEERPNKSNKIKWAKKIKTKCLNCGKTIKRYKSLPTLKHCSHNCLSKNLARQREEEKNRKCSICLKTKSITDYYFKSLKPKFNPPNRYGHCKLCHKKLIYEWNEKNPERKKELDLKAAKKYCENNREKLRERTKQWRLDNLEKFKEIDKRAKKRRYDNDPIYRAKVVRESKEYYKKNKKRILEKSHKYYLAKRA